MKERTQAQIAAVFAHHVAEGTATPEMERQLLDYLTWRRALSRPEGGEAVDPVAIELVSDAIRRAETTWLDKHGPGGGSVHGRHTHLARAALAASPATPSGEIALREALGAVWENGSLYPNRSAIERDIEFRVRRREDAVNKALAWLAALSQSPAAKRDG